MNSSELQKIIDGTVESLTKLMATKGEEYSGAVDRLANFKRGGKRVELHPMQVLWIYASKHIDSIETFIRKEAKGVPQALSEPIEGRLDDRINYCILLKGLIAEERQLPQQAQKAI